MNAPERFARFDADYDAWLDSLSAGYPDQGNDPEYDAWLEETARREAKPLIPADLPTQADIETACRLAGYPCPF